MWFSMKSSLTHDIDELKWIYTIHTCLPIHTCIRIHTYRQTDNTYKHTYICNGHYTNTWNQRIPRNTSTFEQNQIIWDTLHNICIFICYQIFYNIYSFTLFRTHHIMFHHLLSRHHLLLAVTIAAVHNLENLKYIW